MLRRLKQVRRALRDADPMQENVADCARRYGFTELGRLAGVYRTTCGETPSATAPRPGNPIPEPVNSSNLHSGTKILRSRLANGFGSSLGVHHLGSSALTVDLAVTAKVLPLTTLMLALCHLRWPVDSGDRSGTIPKSLRRLINPQCGCTNHSIPSVHTNARK